jgi:hypothetical protein
MATIASTVLTMLDWGKSIDPDGKVAKTVELLSQSNRILDDMLFKEGNLPTGEQTSIRTGLPTVYYRLINQGTPKSKSTKAQVTENAAILSARSEVDQDEAELNGNVNAYRMSEADAFVEAMSQQQAETLIYGSAANPEEYVGFAPRYNDLDAVNGQNILDAGGASTDNTSIWLVNWGENKVFGVFPKGSQAGLSHEDLGLGDAFDASNNRFRAYMDEWKWKNGLVVKDWREVVRIANIDVSDLVAKATTQAITASTAIHKLMSRSIDHLPNGPGANAAFYCNRTVASHLRVMALDVSSSAVTIEPGLNQFGETIHEMRFLGIPVRLVDRILNSEAEVTT